MSNRKGLFIVIFTFFIMTVSSLAYTDEGYYFQCDSANDCKLALQNNTKEYVLLNGSYTGNFNIGFGTWSNKVFDCRGYLITGTGSSIAVQIGGTSNNFTIQNCRFNLGGSAIGISGTNIKIFNNTFGNNADGNIQFGTLHGSLIQNNTFEFYNPNPTYTYFYFLGIAGLCLISRPKV